MQNPGQYDAHFPEVFYPDRKTVCTDAFSHFLSEYHANLDFFFFVVQLVGRVDENRLVASRALLAGETTPEKRARYETSLANRDAALSQLKTHSTVQSRNLTNGIVNAFQRYFSEIINAATQKRPQMLSSSQTVRVDDVLRFSKHKELVAFIIDRKINELSYGGLTDMEKYFDERLGVRMSSDNRQRELMRLFVEIRNINVHNGGIVNDLFASRVGTVAGFPYTKGENFHVDMEALVTLSGNAMHVALHIDATVSGKFSLKRKAYRSWKGPKKQLAGGKANHDHLKADLQL